MNTINVRVLVFFSLFITGILCSIFLTSCGESHFAEDSNKKTEAGQNISDAGKTNDNVIYSANKTGDGKLFYLPEDTIKIVENNCILKFYHHTDSGWKEFYSGIISPELEQIEYVAGISKDYFHVITVDHQYNFHSKVWNGLEYKAADSKTKDFLRADLN